MIYAELGQAAPGFNQFRIDTILKTQLHNRRLTNLALTLTVSTATSCLKGIMNILSRFVNLIKKKKKNKYKNWLFYKYRKRPLTHLMAIGLLMNLRHFKTVINEVRENPWTCLSP